MCGRYGRRGDKQRIAEWMQTHNTNVFDEIDDTYLAPSYNVAPQSFQPVVRLSHETGERELTVMRWGLVPFWSKDGKASFSTINAKSETVATSPAFSEAWRQRRCLVPADWFYEWSKTNEKNKQPFAIAEKDDSMFAFAGLWETWKEGDRPQAANVHDSHHGSERADGADSQSHAGHSPSTGLRTVAGGRIRHICLSIYSNLIRPKR